MNRIRQLENEIAKELSQPLTGCDSAAPRADLEVPKTRPDFQGIDLSIAEDIVAASDLHSIIAESDLEGNITFVNDNFVKLSKYSREELIGSPHSILRSNHHPNSFFERMWKTIQSGQVWRGTIKNRAKDGSHYWVKTLIKPIKNSEGVITKYIAIRTNVTSRLKLTADKKRLEKKAQNTIRINHLFALKRDNKTLAEILKLSLSILFAAQWPKRQPSGGILLADRAAKSVSLVCSYQMGLEDESTNCNIALCDQLCGKAARAGHMVFEQNDSSVSNPSIKYAVPITIGDQLLGVLLVILQQNSRLSEVEEENLNDFSNALAVIISFKQREEELVAEKQKAEVAAEIAEAATLDAHAGQKAKTNFLATMSHELRTPLNGVVGMLHVLKQSELNQEQREDVDVAMASAEMLLTLINDILDFSKLDYGSLTMERAVIDLRKLVQNANVPLQQMAQDKGLSFSCTIAEDVPEFCLGDPTRIRQIGVNLVSNAIKFTETGTISLSVEMCDPPTGKTGGQWTLSKIEDTGIGISAEAQAVVFDRFAQADDTITRKFGGTGLGLAICKQLVELMGGEIGLQSEKGKGSCFWYKLPCIEVDAQGNRIRR